MPAHASGTIVSISLQCPLPWLGGGEPKVIGEPTPRFVRNTDHSELDEYWYSFFDKAIPLEMLDRAVAEVDTLPMDHRDPLFSQYPGVHSGPDAGDRRILSAQLPGTRGDIQCSEIMYQDLPTTMDLSNLIRRMFTRHWIASTSSTTLSVSLPKGTRGRACIAICIRSLVAYARDRLLCGEL